MNTGIDVVQIQRFGALYIAAARLRSMAKWKSIIAAVDIGNPLFYLIAVGVGIGVLVEKGSGTSGTSGIKYIAFIAPALLASSAIAAVMDETVFPTIEDLHLMLSILVQAFCLLWSQFWVAQPLEPLFYLPQQ